MFSLLFFRSLFADSVLHTMFDFWWNIFDANQQFAVSFYLLIFLALCVMLSFPRNVYKFRRSRFFFPSWNWSNIQSMQTLSPIHATMISIFLLNHFGFQDTLYSFNEAIANQFYFCDGACDEFESLKSLIFKYIWQIAAKFQLNFDSVFSMNYYYSKII